jgi:uncharacterized protein (TIGR00251 family)
MKRSVYDRSVKLVAKGDAVRFEVHARPRAKKSRVLGVREGRLDVSLAAPPVDGAANEELVATLAKALGVPKSRVSLVRGESGRTKLVEVRGLTLDEVRARLG